MSLKECFSKRQGALICKLPPHEELNANNEDILRLVKDSKALFARWTSKIVFEQKDEPLSTADIGWWYCIRAEHISLDNLTSKQRYRVKKGLKNNRIYRATPQFIDRHRKQLFDCYVASTLDYPPEYREDANEDRLFEWLRPATEKENADIWIVEDIASNNIVGFAHCRLSGNMVEMSSVKLNPAYFKNEVNAVLVYELCHYYLNDRQFLYICDGERNIRHKTEYQDFLVRVLGFRKVHCQLHIAYHPFLKPFVFTLYPFRRFIGQIARGNKFLYNAYCVLMQEQYRRESLLEYIN